MLRGGQYHHMREEPFTCTLCGKCCMGFGRYITIIKRTGPQEYLCQETITRQEFTAGVEAEYLPFFRRPSVQWSRPTACPFLREDSGRYICTIYSHRPEFCREYICARMRVLKGGEIAGELKGRRTLKTDDRRLQRVWDDEIEPLSLPDPEWEKETDRVLTGAGYETVWYRQQQED